MTIQLAGATAELVKALKKQDEEKGIDLTSYGWFMDCFEINDAMEEVGMIVKLDWYTTESDGFVMIGFWSDKIGRWIILDSSVKYVDESFKDLAEKLVAYNDEARTLEAKLTKINR